MYIQIIFVYDDNEIYFLPYDTYKYYYKPQEEVVELLKEKGEANSELRCMLERNTYVLDFPEFTDFSRCHLMKSYETYKESNPKKSLKDYNTYIWERKVKLMSINMSNTKLKCINLKSDISKRQKWNDYMKDYYYNHIEQKQKYYQDKKESLNEKIECSCGKTFTKQNKKRHEKSKYHQTHN